MLARCLTLLLCLLSLVWTAMPAHAQASSFEPNWSVTRVSAAYAWSQGADGHGVSVLVIDTGLDRTVATTALAGSILPSMAVNPVHTQVPIACPPGPDDYPQSCSKNATLANPSAYVDTVGHGTFVVSEIAGHGAAFGYWGIAPQAKVAMAKVSAGETIDSGDLARAIRWGGIHRFPVISMSLGSPSADPAIADAVRFAQKQGSIVVAASGNEGSPTPDYPGAFGGVISVGASDKYDQVPVWSNAQPSLVAPGAYVYGIAPDHETAIGCGGLCEWPGTSMATPYVVGALADLLSVGLTHQQAVAALLHGARRWPEQNWRGRYGAGVLDLRGALAYARAHEWLRHV